VNVTKDLSEALNLGIFTRTDVWKYVLHSR
jgi:uncharacterized protein (UPF0147 family)